MSTKMSQFSPASALTGTESLVGLQGPSLSEDNALISLPQLMTYLSTLTTPTVFTGGGSTFALPRAPLVPAAAVVTLNGVELTYTTDYSITGTTLTLVTAATTSDVVKARYL